MSSPIRIVKDKAEFEAVVVCQWAGFTSPYEAFWAIWFPTDLGAHFNDPARSRPREDAFSESVDRLWKEHVDDPHSTWIYIADEEQSRRDGKLKVLASCQWRVYSQQTAPFPSDVPEIQCPAWPRGTNGGIFVTAVMRAVYAPRSKWMARPHVGLSWMAVSPTAREQGLGLRLMEWGLQRADEFGLEMFIEGTDLGSLLYQRSGLKELQELVLVLSKPEEADKAEWEQLVAHYLPEPFHFHMMWRPANGDWKDEPEKSWRRRWATWDGTKGQDGNFLIERT